MQFKSNRVHFVPASLAIILAAGSSAAIAGPDGAAKDKRQAQKYINGQQDGKSTLKASDVQALHFALSGELIGAELENRAGESLGSIEDFIVERGSGSIVFAVVKSGDFLGLGGKSFAMPYRDLALRNTDNVFTANMTPELVERQTEFLPDDWTDLTTTDWMKELGAWVTGDDEKSRDEKIRTAVMEQDGRPLQGQIVGIDRSGFGDAELASVTILTESNERFIVVLGPSWHVLGSENAPYRGQRIDVVAVDVDGMWYATEARIDGNTMKLRNDDGTSTWSTHESTDTPRYFLLSDLIGRSVEIAGSTSGEVQSAIVETRSGSVAFIGLDPNENFLGMADTIRLTPWSVMRVDSRLGVSLDTSPADFEEGMQVPESLAELTSVATLEQAYAAFGVKPASFERREHRREARPAKDRVGDAWGRDAKMIKAFADGETIEFGGIVREQAMRSVAGGAEDAWVITVDTEAGDRRQVIVAPGWFKSRQAGDFQRGDRVVVQGRTATIGNEQWVGAWIIKHGDRTYTFWNGENPVWID